MKLKITTIGNSAGVILPKELLARLRLEKGDERYPTGYDSRFTTPNWQPRSKSPKR